MTYRRAVRFDEVDGANIVFFARYPQFAHEAMEHFFSPIEGGYPRLTMERKVGFPAVDLHVSWKAPLRYGDVARIETEVVKLGGKSFVLRYRMFRDADDVLACQIEHTVVTCDLATMRSIEMPTDVRATVIQHLAPEDAA
jgi:4-hydroxybenzoyl-CoA thioesterase